MAYSQKLATNSVYVLRVINYSIATAAATDCGSYFIGHRFSCNLVSASDCSDVQAGTDPSQPVIDVGVGLATRLLRNMRLSQRNLPMSNS